VILANTQSLCKRPPGAVVDMSRGGELKALTGIRFVAALFVFFYHWGSVFSSFLPGFAEGLRCNGYVGVSFFFALSGFILAYNYARPGSPTMRRIPFWMARFARIYPTYLLAFLVYGVFVVHHRFARDEVGLAVLKTVVSGSVSLSLLQGWAVHSWASWNTPSWSISVEAFFYAVFPFVAPRLLAGSQRRVLASIALLWVSSLVVPGLFVTLAPKELVAWSAGPGRLVETLGNTTAYKLLPYLDYNPLLHLPTFLMGAIVGANWTRGNIRVYRVGATVGSIISLFVLCRHPGSLYLFIHSGLLAPCFLSVICYIACGQGAASRLLSTRLMSVLGDASYGMYILQSPLWIMYCLAVFGTWEGRQSIPIVLSFLVVWIAMSVLICVYFERPARRFIRNFSKKKVTGRGSEGLAVRPEDSRAS
jgi:peptidoglycan/LPS O-acetylase OafA/YrhL